MEGKAGLDVLGAAHAVEDTDQLKRARKPETRDAIGRHALDGLPGKPDAAGVRTQHARNQIERRGLAGTVGTEQADNLA